MLAADCKGQYDGLINPSTKREHSGNMVLLAARVSGMSIYPNWKHVHSLSPDNRKKKLREDYHSEIWKTVLMYVGKKNCAHWKILVLTKCFPK